MRAAYAVLAPARPWPTLLGEAVIEASIALTVIVFVMARRLLPPSHFDAAAAMTRASVRLALAACALAGLVLNASFGLWKADPLSALPLPASSSTRASILFCEEDRRTNGSDSTLRPPFHAEPN